MLISEIGRRVGLIKALVVLFVLSNLFLFISHSNDGIGFMEISRLPSTRRTQVVDPSYLGKNVEDFSSCLVVRKQDLAKLPEWLAYHYYALQTRSVMVLPDPEIDGTVTEILEKWKSLIEVVIFTERNLIDAQDNSRTAARREHEDESTFQSRREASFFHNCASRMKESGRTMVSFQNVDEYAAINVDAVTNTKSLMTEPSAVVRLLQYALQSGKLTDSTCIPMYHSQFSNIPSNAEDIHTDTPNLLQGQRLDTLQWRYRSSETTGVMGKALVNVSLLPSDRSALSVTQYGTIRGRFEFAPYCPTTPSEPKPIFRMHVYPRDDQAASTSDVTNQDILNDSLAPWIKGFVDQVGAEKAQSLLQPESDMIAPDRSRLRTRR